MNMMNSNIKKMRLKKHLRQSDIAKIIGISQQQYSRLESSYKGLTIDKAIALADFFDVSLDELFGRDSVSKQDRKKLLLLINEIKAVLEKIKN